MKFRFSQVLSVISMMAIAACSGGGSVTPSVGSGSSQFPTLQPNTRAACGGPYRKGFAHCLALFRTDVGGTPPTRNPHGPHTPLGKHAKAAPRHAMAGTPSGGYGPNDIQSAYNLPAANGAGQTVAIVDANDDPNAEADLAAYRSYYGLPECSTANGCFQKTDQNGGTNYPAADDGWAGEISLDLDMVSATCPNCHILLVEANSASNADLDVAENEAASLGATEISNSFGGGEGSADDSAYNHAGIVVTASAGDSGTGASQPCSYAEVVCVGGTSLTYDSVNGYGGESVWSGSGSGCSAVVSKPSWQTDSGCTMRSEADVAAVADPQTGVAVYDTYGSAQGWQVVGGTSASSPIIASVFALAGNAASVNAAQGIWADAGASTRNVSSGSNGTCDPSYQYICNGGLGYNGPTGWGTPNGIAAF